MVPGCTKYQAHARDMEEYQDDDELNEWDPDELYPEYGFQPDTVPDDIRDWMCRRRYLVRVWKLSYIAFIPYFTRQVACWGDSYTY
jgi:hypothetical protein